MLLCVATNDEPFVLKLATNENILPLTAEAVGFLLLVIIDTNWSKAGDGFVSKNSVTPDNAFVLFLN